jgi:hypothetical protein
MCVSSYYYIQRFTTMCVPSYYYIQRFRYHTELHVRAHHGEVQLSRRGYLNLELDALRDS